MLGDAVAHLPREVQPAAVVLEEIDDAKALHVVIEAARHQLVDDFLAGVPERRVAEIVPESDRFGQLFVEAQHFGDRPGDLRDLERVRQARPVMIAGRREKHLCLVLEATERLAVNDAVAIALKRRSNIVLALRTQTAPRIGAFGPLRRQDFAFAPLELFADRGHG